MTPPPLRSDAPGGRSTAIEDLAPDAYDSLTVRQPATPARHRIGGLVIPEPKGNAVRSPRLMKIPRSCFLIASLTVVMCHADEILFQDDFEGRLGEGWSWVREHREGWRATRHGLEVRVEPGNMWGPANNASNVLIRTAPTPAKDEIEVSVFVENKPTEQYEQVDLVWYYDDSHMVKLGQELVDGKLSIVMGREENDRTRTLAIIPLDSFSVRLRFRVNGNRIRGQFRTPDSKDWRDAGECDLPAPASGKALISLQFYQGPAKAERWARATEFRVRRVAK